MTMMMHQIVRYSKRLTRPYVSQTACASVRQHRRTDSATAVTHLLDEIESEDEDERADDADREVANHSWPRKEDACAGEGEEEARDAGRAADLVKEYRVDCVCYVQ